MIRLLLLSLLLSIQMPRFYSFDLFAIILSISCLPLLFLSALPSNHLWYLMAFFLFIIAIIAQFKYQASLLLVAVFLLGFLWSTAYAKQYLISIEPYIDKTLSVVVKIESSHPYSETSPQSSYYVQCSIIKIADNDLTKYMPISILWDKPNNPMAGQIWHLTLTTKVVHSNLNEAGFDQQRFAMANRTLLLGKLIDAILLDESINIKQTIINHGFSYIKLFAYQDILFALAFGDRSLLTEENRTIMMQTGITHLMAISGMHIILVFLISQLLVKGLYFFVPQRFIYYIVPIVIGWLCAFFYAWLTGLNPPALRAILTLSIWIYLRYKNNQLSAWQKINRIIAILLIFDPLMILSESFWLSCYAVICLIFLFEWLPLPVFIRHKKRWYIVRLLHLQFGLTLLLLPIQILVFQGISSSALLANLIAIPIISLVTFPAILFALLFTVFDCFYITLYFWFTAEKSLQWLFYCLNKLNFLWVYFSYHFILLSLIGWFAILIYRTALWRRFWITITMGIIIAITPFIKQQDYIWRLDMLDVGHGLAVVLHNGKSAILYDTGASWQKSSTAERVILPFLRWYNLDLQGIIISHQHNDHIGGLGILQNIYPHAWLMSSSAKLNNDYNCIVGNQFDWNDLNFKVLWPYKTVDYAQNEDSCVIQISDGYSSVLLTGDLERQQEYQLVSTYRQTLGSTFLQIPHHGSNTSSSYAFLNQVSPNISLASTSRYNPWKLPSHKIISRYRELQLDYYVTDQSGQISLFFNKQTWVLKTMRENIKPRWYHSWFGDQPNYN